FHRPVNRIAGQAVFAGQRPNAPAFQPAEAALRRSPECAIRTEPKVQDLTGAEAIFCRVRDTEPVSREVRDPASVETKPDAALARAPDRPHSGSESPGPAQGICPTASSRSRISPRCRLTIQILRAVSSAIESTYPPGTAPMGMNRSFCRG